MFLGQIYREFAPFYFFLFLNQLKIFTNLIFSFLFPGKSEYAIYRDPNGLYLNFSGFDYKFDRPDNYDKSHKKYWKCRHFRNKDYEGGCRGRIILGKDGLIKISHEHNHGINGFGSAPFFENQNVRGKQ